MASPGSLHMNTSIENIEFTKEKVFGQLMLAVGLLARGRHGRQKLLIPKGDLTGTLEERSTITLLPVWLHSGIDTFCLP